MNYHLELIEKNIYCQVQSKLLKPLWKTNCQYLSIFEMYISIAGAIPYLVTYFKNMPVHVLKNVSIKISIVSLG